MYHKVKGNKDIEMYGEKGWAFYVINSNWIIQWHGWIQQKQGFTKPGPIKNAEIAKRIQDYRFSGKHIKPVHDNGITLNEPKDCYVLSSVFWRAFAERYGVDIEIKVVKYDKVEDMVDQQIRIKGQSWMSFEVNQSMHYDIYEELQLMPIPERRQAEMNLMN